MAFIYRSNAIYNGASSAEPVCNKPTGTVNGDIMFAFINNSSLYVKTAPTGWTRLGQMTSTYKFELFYKIASNEPSSYTWIFDTPTKTSITISSFYGDFNVSNPVSVVSNTQYITLNRTCRATSMSIANTNSPLIFFGSNYKTTAVTYTKPSVPTTDWIENYDGGSEDSDFYQEVCSMIWSSSGETGNIDATLSTSSQYKHAFAVALNPLSILPNIKTINGLAKSSVKTINGLAIASLKTINGLA